MASSSRYLFVVQLWYSVWLSSTQLGDSLKVRPIQSVVIQAGLYAPKTPFTNAPEKGPPKFILFKHNRTVLETL